MIILSQYVKSDIARWSYSRQSMGCFLGHEAYNFTVISFFDRAGSIWHTVRMLSPV